MAAKVINSLQSPLKTVWCLYERLRYLSLRMEGDFCAVWGVMIEKSHRLDRACAERLTGLADIEFYNIGRQV